MSGFSQQADWPFYVYNFGGLKNLSQTAQVDTLHKIGYDGISLTINNKNDGLVDFSGYMKRVGELNGFEIYSVFFRYNYTDSPEFRDNWRKVIDKISGTDIGFWFIFGRPHKGFNEAHIDSVLRRVVDYAVTKDVIVTLYPHHHDVIPTAYDAIKWVEHIDSPNLNMVVHSCHELRSGNGDRIEEVLKRCKDHLAFVTIAGADEDIDFTNPISIENSSIKPLYRGNYDVKRILVQLKKQNYKGAVGFINHLIREDMGTYLSKSLDVYKGWLDEINTSKPVEPFDAPDQVTWHAPSKTWFVSNLGGGISLARDGYGWITRLNADGKVINPRWIDNLDAPSGMVLTDKLLYVCDRDGVYEIDIEQEKINIMYPIKGGEFINDIAMAKNGDLYVSDFFRNTIYKLPKKGRKAEVFVQGDELESPDGLYVEGNELIIASWGVINDTASFGTSKKGEVLSVNLKTKKITKLISELSEVGNLEGITKAGEHYFISDWASGEILKVSKHGGREVFMSGLKHPTDPDYAKGINTLAFPQHGTNQVLFIKLDDLVK
jgi:sugar phosphate isomerase/epimerase